MKCEYCGAEIANDSIYCEFCGKKVNQKSNKNLIVLFVLLGTVGVLVLAILIGLHVSGVIDNGENSYVEDPTTEFAEETVEDSLMQEYVDLGLPSGTLWSSQTEEGLYTQEEAINTFGQDLPTVSELWELKENCEWRVEGCQYKITGPNGNYILLSANGKGESNSHYRAGNFGAYWSSSITNDSENGLGFYIDDEYFFMWYFEPNETMSVRLVKREN